MFLRWTVLVLMLGLLVPPFAHAALILRVGELALDPADQCLVLETRSQGNVLLDDYGGFALGDSVVAAAPFQNWIACGPTRAMHPYLPGNTIGPWHDFDFGCGPLVEGGIVPGCFVFDSPDYGPFLIDANDPFGAGDTVRVWGEARLQCITTPECSAPNCIHVSRITACADTNTAVQRVDWGAVKHLFR